MCFLIVKTVSCFHLLNEFPRKCFLITKTRFSQTTQLAPIQRRLSRFSFLFAISLAAACLSTIFFSAFRLWAQSTLLVYRIIKQIFLVRLFLFVSVLFNTSSFSKTWMFVCVLWFLLLLLCYYCILYFCCLSFFISLSMPSFVLVCPIHKTVSKRFMLLCDFSC